MAGGKNAYLAKQAEKQMRRDMTVFAWAQQITYDALTLVLNDTEVMGRDVFGEKRLNKLREAANAKVNEILPGLSAKAPNASYVRAMTDRELEKICKDSFLPWEERYDDWDDRGI